MFVQREPASLFETRCSQRGATHCNYHELVKLALFCAEQARASPLKDVAREAWRLAMEYGERAAKLGEPPNIGEKPRRVEEAE
jgi:hypothetical protein